MWLCLPRGGCCCTIKPTSSTAAHSVVQFTASSSHLIAQPQVYICGATAVKGSAVLSGHRKGKTYTHL